MFSPFGSFSKDGREMHIATPDIPRNWYNYFLKNKTAKNVIYTSAKTGDVFDKLLKTIKIKMHKLMGASESKIAINERTYELLNESVSELQNAIKKYNGNYDIFAEHTRRAGDAIGKILGVITTNEIADATFSRLCLGK